MPEAEGLSRDFDDVDKIQPDLLESIAYAGNKQEIIYETTEFSAVCPFSGLPDLAKVTVRYIPNDKIVELKSLKYYFYSYRNVGIYQEAVTDRIYKDLEKVLQPGFLSIQTIYNTRGGIDATCIMDTDIVQGVSKTAQK